MYNEYRLTNSPDLHEVLVALLGDAGFDSFQETEEGLRAYGTAAEHERWVAALDTLSPQFGFSYTYEALPDRNWNEEWESQFPPLYVGDRLYIRADFHPEDPSIPLELVITPKMAFGTGHHATTYMMCELLFDLDLAGKKVLDYGSGTGVLAILGKKLGAGPTDAVDIEAPAAESTQENAERNGVELATVVHGVLDDVPDSGAYDLIVANINRNVILATAATLYARLLPGGDILFSGILAQDEDLLRDKLTEAGFLHQETRAREDWRAFHFTRPA